MHKHYKVFILIAFAFCICITTYSKTPKDSAAKVIHNITAFYQKGKLSDTAYLDSIYTTMSSFRLAGIAFANKETLELLKPYQAISWSNKDYKSYKRLYYAMLSNQAQMASRLGEMLYYGEKINEIEEKNNKQPSLAALTIIGDYYNTLWSYKNTRALYLKNRDYILDIPKIAARDKDKINITQLVQASIMLSKFGDALYNLNDTAYGKEVESVLDTISAIAKDKYSSDYLEIANIEFSRLLVLYEKGKALKSRLVIWESIRKFAELLADKHTPDDLKGAIAFTITDKKIVSFLDENNPDSARHYINIMDKIYTDKTSIYDEYMIKKYKARVLYEQGLYKASTDSLVSTIELSEKIRKNVVQDVSDMMYAQAKSEEQELLLAEAARKQKLAKRRIQIILSGTALSIILGTILFLYFRQRQRSRFLQFKLNIARNIHDETNPSLLYAKALAKSVKDNPDDKQLIEAQIGHTMEVIRSLSHDLKADKLKTIADLVADIAATLGKLNVNDTFTYHIHTDADEKRFLSHYQFTQLRAILHEAITNTIKHATFDTINISLNTAGNRVHITYDDNGSGWADSTAATGIGIKNMEERAANLNGSLAIQNNYPDGYQLSVSALLR